MFLDTMLSEILIMKNEVVHARIQSDIKRDSEKVLSIIGITISQAIDLFLRQVVLKKDFHLL